ncbi:MAG: hypothetical protein GWP18_04980 [Proteobacteria bacterium]|nr:hypothetical protein [Pseudomonadota bacterium]
MKVLLSLVAIAFVAAATPSEVAPVVATDGYFIETGSDATANAVGTAVADARFAGGALSVVVLAEEPSSGATVFGDAVLDRLPSSTGTVLVVAPETVGWASAGDIWTNDQLDAALDASLDGSSSDDVVEIFVAELIEPSSGGSSGLLIFVGFIVVVGGAIAFLVVRASKRQREEALEQVESLRATAQLQIDAIANDILDLEDEVRMSDDAAVQDHYTAAIETYTGASEKLGGLSSGRDIVDFDYELDVAVWRLDTAEAMLDGNPLPEKPARPQYQPPTVQETSRGSTSSDERGVTAPLPEYRRRPQRRSSFGAAEMAAAVLASQAMRGMGGRRGMGGGRRGSSRSSGRSSSPRMRGGGRRRG